MTLDYAGLDGTSLDRRLANSLYILMPYGLSWTCPYRDMKKIPKDKREMYTQSYAQDGAMRAAFEYFKTFNAQDAEDNRKFAAHKLPMPVLVITGNKSMGDVLEMQAKIVVDDVTSIKFADTGHWLMEEATGEVVPKLVDFLTR